MPALESRVCRNSLSTWKPTSLHRRSRRRFCLVHACFPYSKRVRELRAAIRVRSRSAEGWDVSFRRSAPFQRIRPRSKCLEAQARRTAAIAAVVVYLFMTAVAVFEVPAIIGLPPRTSVRHSIPINTSKVIRTTRDSVASTLYPHAACLRSGGKQRYPGNVGITSVLPLAPFAISSVIRFSSARINPSRVAKANPAAMHTAPPIATVHSTPMYFATVPA